MGDFEFFESTSVLLRSAVDRSSRVVTPHVTRQRVHNLSVFVLITGFKMTEQIAIHEWSEVALRKQYISETRDDILYLQSLFAIKIKFSISLYEIVFSRTTLSHVEFNHVDGLVKHRNFG